MRRFRGVLRGVLLAGIGVLACGGVQAQAPPQPPQVAYLQGWHLAITPNDVAADPATGNMAVVSAGNGVIQLLRPGGTPLAQLRGLRDPRSAAFTPGGVLLVGEAGTGSVKGYELSGKPVLTLGSSTGEFLTPNDIAVDPSGALAFVVDSAAASVKAYALPGGAFQFGFGSPGAGDGELDWPISAAVDAGAGEVFVGDSRNRRIAVFDAADGAFLRNIGVAGDGSGEISFVAGLHADADHRLYTVESLGGFVQVLDPQGGFIAQIGDHGAGPALLRSPKAVVIDRYNRLLVTSFLDSKIEVWGLDLYENPLDQDLSANLLAIPHRLIERREAFTVTIEVPGIPASFLDPDSIRLNGVVRPVAGSYRLGPRLAVRFRSADVLSLLPPWTTGSVVLELKGKTFQGLRFEGSLRMILPRTPQPEVPSRQAPEPRWNWRQRQ